MIFEKIREKIEELHNEACFPCDFVSESQGKVYNYFESKLKEILKLTDEYNNGWIPCSERLPEDGQCVVVQVKDHYALEDGVPIQIRKFDTRYEGHNWKEIGDGRWIANHCVIAWQPLPEPYTQKGE